MSCERSVRPVSSGGQGQRVTGRPDRAPPLAELAGVPREPARSTPRTPVRSAPLRFVPIITTPLSFARLRFAAQSCPGDARFA